ncbi:hypothetical protein ACE1TI_02380 [Alteribacillus sp. JSM 102045]|uniref:hypothetical protein n=1 Tax=Alteribacillus sp. JSM 102045 TaxID=1562101 RepID=UPI0035C26582
MASEQEKDHEKKRTQVSNKEESSKNQFEKQKHGQSKKGAYFTFSRKKSKAQKKKK